MKEQSIVTVPDKGLSQRSPETKEFNQYLKHEAEVLKETLRSNADYGIGLAANQLGLKNRIFVVEFEDPEKKDIIPLRFFVNPEIVEKSEDSELLDEGCLSVPDIFLPISRSTKIKVRAKDLFGKTFKLTAKGLFARLIQHETDHLNGTLFVDKARAKLLRENPKIKDLKIVFIGSGDFADLILRGLILLGFNIRTVITEKSKPQGRKQKVCDTPVGSVAKLFGRKLIEADNTQDLSSKLLDLGPDLIILADFGQVIPEIILKTPKLGAINIHPSLLPKYRGPSPVQTAILENEKETGVSIIKITPQIDEGPILSQQTIEIVDEDNSHTLKKRLSNLGLKMLVEILPKIQNGEIKGKEQDNTKATITHKFQKKDGEIDWKKPLERIVNQIRAFYPWPGAYTFIDNKRLIILASHMEEKKLFFDVVQPEGKKPMLWRDFVNGFRGKKPAWFSKVSSK